MKYIIITILIAGCQIKQDCPKVEERFYPTIENKTKPIFREFNGKIYIYENGVWIDSERYEKIYL